MLNAAEATIYQSAKDEAEIERLRAELYAPPRSAVGGVGVLTGPTKARAAVPAGQKLTLRDAQALMAQMASEDARHTARR
jgi:hypothetical protein